MSPREVFAAFGWATTDAFVRFWAIITLEKINVLLATVIAVLTIARLVIEIRDKTRNKD